MMSFTRVVMSHVVVRRHRIVVWDCFGNAILSFIGCNKVTQETGSELVPKKQSRSAVRRNNDPVSLTISKWPITSVVVADSSFVFCQGYVLVSALLRFCCCFLYQVVSLFRQNQRSSYCVVSGLADDMIFLISGKTSEKLFFNRKYKYKYVLILHSFLNWLKNQRPNMVIKLEVYQAMRHWLLVCLATAWEIGSREKTQRAETERKWRWRV